MLFFIIPGTDMGSGEHEWGEPLRQLGAGGELPLAILRAVDSGLLASLSRFRPIIISAGVNYLVEKPSFMQTMYLNLDQTCMLGS